MVNVIIYDFTQKNKYPLQKLVDDLESKIQDETQGVIINEYDEKFLKARFWQKKIQKSHRFNPERRDFDIIEEEIVSDRKSVV